MKMISRRRSNDKGRFIFFSLFLVVALVLGLVFRDATMGVISYIGKPVLKSALTVVRSTSFTSSLFGSKADLVRERDELKERNRILESEKEERTLSDSYSEDIKKVLEGAKDERIIASVLSRPNFTPYDSLLLDKGSREGVRNSALLYGTGNRVIGYIAHAYETLSHAVLFSTAGIESVVYIPSTHALVRAVGAGGGVMRLTIPQSIDVQEGSLVSYPTLSPSPIGVISRIVKTETNPDIFAYVTLADSPFNVFVVGVGTSIFKSPSEAELEKNMEPATTTSQGFFTVPEGYKVIVSTSTVTSTATSTGTSTIR